MKKLFTSIFSAVLLSSAAVTTTFAQSTNVFLNPLRLQYTEGLTISFGASNGNGMPLSQDTVLALQPIIFDIAIVSTQFIDFDKIASKSYDINLWLKTYYNDVYAQENYLFNNDTLKSYSFDKMESGMAGKNSVFGTGRAGKYSWYIGINPDSCCTGKVEFDRDAAYFVTGSSNGSTKDLFVNMPLEIKGGIYSGFPYKVSDFQGKARFKVYDPDSILIASQEYQLKATNDSAMLEYIENMDICKVDSAKEGGYKVVLEGDWMPDAQTTYVYVTDPLVGASSRNTIDATYRLKAKNFDATNRVKWDLSTTAPVTYPEDKKLEETAMLVKKATENDDESFTLSQTMTKMPQGWYQLIWPSFYQPCDLANMKVSYPVLGQITGNSASQDMVHIYDGATVTGSGNYSTLTLPANDAGALSALSLGYRDTVAVEVGADSILTIGAKAKASGKVGAWIGLGEPKLLFCGQGLPYGDVHSLKSDSIYTAEDDSIKYNVSLVDGVGVKVPSDNTIMAYVCKGKDLSINNILLQTIVDANKAGDYKIGMQLPEPKEYTSGEYTVYIVSLHMDGTYQVTYQETIALKAGTKPADAKVSEITMSKTATGATYDLSGRRVGNDAPKGIYITDGKKSIK